MKQIAKKLSDIYARSLCLSAEKDPEYFSLAGDLIATDEVQSLAGFVQHDYIDRLRHITSVSYMTFRICKRLSFDARVGARAGILHDLYYYDWHEKDWSHRPHGYRHPGFAVKNARILCGSLDKKTENTIRRHMWPLTVVPPRYAEGYVICFADKYCASRELAECKKNKRNTDK